MEPLNSPFSHKNYLWVFTLTKTENVNEEGEAAETGNVLLPSTHLSIQMSTPLREHPHVSMNSSGHDPLEHKKQILWETSCSEVVPLQGCARAIYCKHDYRHLYKTLTLKQAITYSSIFDDSSHIL